jgi:DNA replication protein DnaC
MTPTPTTECAPETIKQHATTLKLHGLLAHWDELTDIQLTWVDQWLQWETRERQQRGLQRRLHAAHLGRFKPLADFDWNWPKHCDKATVSALMRLDFIAEALNVILVGPNGVGKTLIAQNLAYQAIMQGHSAVFVNAAQLLGDLAAQDGDSGLRRRFAHYARPDVLVIDEIGYLSYGTRHADLLFEIINRRYERKPTIITTNRPFAEWSEVFPNAACVVSIVDRLVHHAEILVIEGESYRMREAKARAARKTKKARATRQRKIDPASTETGDQTA